jgi:hypothetical protein
VTCPVHGRAGAGLAVDLGQDAVEDEVVKLVLAVNVAVQRGGNHAEAGSEGAHAQGRCAMAADDRESLSHETVAGEHAAAVLLAVRRTETTGAGARVVACCLPLDVHTRLH